MDRLETLHRFDQHGGEERRQHLEELLQHARALGCHTSLSGGKTARMHFKYGTALELSTISVDAKGKVTVYAHPGDLRRTDTDPVHTVVNSILDEHEEMTPKTYPINNHSQLEETFEEIPLEELVVLLRAQVAMIRETVYDRSETPTVEDLLGEAAA